MSKSVGNVVDPFNLANQYGVDQMRYFFLREVSFGQDGSYNHEAIVARINADLANDLGNLAQRSLSMIAKQHDGVLPEPGAFSDNDNAILAQADAMIGLARTAMATQQIHQWLNAVWAVVAEANRYFAGEAPWALAKTDPPRQRTVLYVTAEVVRQIAILAQPVMPEASAKLLDSLGIPAAARDFAASRAAPCASRPAPNCRRRSGSSRATSNRPRPERSAHACRQPLPSGFSRFRRRSRRHRGAGAGGGHRAHRHHLDAGAAAGRACSRSPSGLPNVYCSVGTHPHQADEEDGIAAEELIELTRHPKVVALGEAGLDYFYTHGSREAQERGFRAHIAAARATGLPLVIHTREADDGLRPHPRGRDGRREAFRAVLHCYTGGRELAMKRHCARAFDFVHRHPDLQEIATPCASSPPSCRPTASWSRPMRRIWRPANFAASATSRPMWSKSPRCWRRPAGSRWRRFPARPRRISSACSARCPLRNAGMTLTLTILGCGSSAGVPRPALGWGACDPNNPKNRRRRCSLLAERASDRGITRVVIDTAPDLREQLIDAEVDHIDAVFLTHEHADQTHGIDDLRSVVLHQRRRIPVYLNRSTAEHILLRFSYCFVSPPGSDYPPILDHHPIEAGESRTIDGKGGPLTLSAFILQHGNIPALGYRICGRRLYA